MARLSLFALFAVALAGIAQGNPLEKKSFLAGQIHTTNSWEYVDCGQWLSR